jgi:excisionase family DNA binding protein
MKKRKGTSTLPTIDPAQLQLLDVPQVMRLLNIGRTKVYDLIKNKELEVVKFGSATRIPSTSLQKCIEAHKHAS